MANITYEDKGYTTIRDDLEEVKKRKRKKYYQRTDMDIPVKCALCGIGIGQSRIRILKRDETYSDWRKFNHIHIHPCTLVVDGVKYLVDPDCLAWAERADLNTVKKYLKPSKTFD